jgi:uncharacterized protein with HEPN domain
MRRDEASLFDIADAIRLALEFLQGLDRAAFNKDLKTQAAVMREITIIGEAARRISVPFRTRHPLLPWPRMVGIRNRLIHEYDQVDLDEVWKVLTDDLPPLLRQIESLLPRQDDDSSDQ